DAVEIGRSRRRSARREQLGQGVEGVVLRVDARPARGHLHSFCRKNLSQNHGTFAPDATPPYWKSFVLPPIDWVRLLLLGFGLAVHGRGGELSGALRAALTGHMLPFAASDLPFELVDDHVDRRVHVLALLLAQVMLAAGRDLDFDDVFDPF